LLHVTVALGATRIDRGVNALDCIATEVVATGFDPPPPPPVPGAVVSEPLPPQARRAANGSRMRRERIGTP
jgi:hypothetical protein